ncbi:MAG: hypothetical protein JEZ00_14040 [Anaerolineaceae bacterium]|nr:hypothetical protein [Anaerolineaceae bacterium]
MRIKRVITTLIIVLFVFVASSTVAKVDASSQTTFDTVILSSQDDPYYALAEEISAAEGLPIFHTFEEASKTKPQFLLWVIAPQNLTEQALINFSLKMKDLPGSISVGIFSGQSLQDARSLWLRGAAHFIPADDYAIINGNGATQKLDPEIIHNNGNGEEYSTTLTKENLLDALANKANVQISLEGAAGSWFDQHGNITVRAEDIPQLDDTVILHYGCSTFRPWVEYSIANACIHQGALAYIGFIYTSIVGTRFGDYTNNGLLYTWENFPLGHLVQIQNQAAMQSYMDAAHFYMLGDPRIYRQSEMPYTMIRDELIDKIRIMEIGDLPAGLIPIHIPDSAHYEFVSIPGFASSSMDSKYFNRKLQMMNINNDKFIILENPTERITIELREKAPLFWQVSSNSVNFLDAVIVDGHNADIFLIFIILLAVLLIVRFLRKRIHKKHLLFGLLFGGLMALVTEAYTILRENHIVVTNAPIDSSPLYLIGIFICTAYGLMLYLDADSRKGKIMAIVVANLYSLLTVLIFTIGLLIKLIMLGNPLSIDKAIYPWLFPLQKLILGTVFYSITYFTVQLGLMKRGILMKARNLSGGTS